MPRKGGFWGRYNRQAVAKGIQRKKANDLKSADKTSKDAQIVAKVGSGVGSAASFIPVVGPILGPAIAGITGAIGGGMSAHAQDKAKKAAATDTSIPGMGTEDPEEDDNKGNW